MKICSKCGSAVEDNFSFCSKCGAHVEAAPSPAGTTVPLENLNTAPAPAPARAAAPNFGYSGAQIDARGQKCLDQLYKRLGHEKTAFTVVGVVSLVFSVIYIFIGIAAAFVTALAIRAVENEGPGSFDAYYSATDFGDGDIDFDFGHADDYDEYYDDGYDDYYDGEYDDGYNGYYGGYYGDEDAYYTDDKEAILFVKGMLVGWAVMYFVQGVFILAAGIVCLVQSARIGRIRNKMYTDCSDAVAFCRSNGMIVLCVFFSFICMVFHIVNRTKVVDDIDTFNVVIAAQRQQHGIIY